MANANRPPVTTNPIRGKVANPAHTVPIVNQELTIPEIPNTLTWFFAKDLSFIDFPAFLSLLPLPVFFMQFACQQLTS